MRLSDRTSHKSGLSDHIKHGNGPNDRIKDGCGISGRILHANELSDWLNHKSKPSDGVKHENELSERTNCFVGCLTFQQHASASKGGICSDNCTCCHTEIEVVDQTFYLTQSQYADTGPTSPSTDPIMPGAWQGSHWGANF